MVVKVSVEFKPITTSRQQLSAGVSLATVSEVFDEIVKSPWLVMPQVVVQESKSESVNSSSRN